MSNLIRTENLPDKMLLHGWALAAALVLTGCGSAQPPADAQAATHKDNIPMAQSSQAGVDMADESKSVKTDAQAKVETSNGISEDRDGSAPDPVKIAGKHNSGAGCDIALSYDKAGAKKAHWQIAPCSDIRAEILTQAQLVEMGHWDDLPIDAVSDIKRYNKAGFLWVEAGQTASIFILDGVMALREVPVAD